MDNENVFVFPTQINAGWDTVSDEDQLFETVDISNGTLLGVVGMRVAADSEYGYDAVYGWQSVFGGQRSTEPYKTLSDAIDGLVNFALTNGQGE